MKQKIIIRDNISGKIIVKTHNLRDKNFYDACQKYHPTTVHRNKKRYNRKQKYKKDLRFDEDL